MKLFQKPLLILTLLLSGCNTDTPQGMLEDYTNRVSNAIEYDFSVDTEADLPIVPQYPAKRDRILPLSDIRVGVIDALAFRHCDLLQLISERNSSLGKLAGDSQRLIYELKAAPALQACRDRLIAQNDPYPELLTQVKQILNTKSDEFPKLLWNTVYNSAEMEQQFALKAAPLPLADANYLNQMPDQLSFFTEIATHAKNNWQVEDLNTAALEKHFEQIYRTNFGSRWLQSVRILTKTLDQTARAINARLDQRPICFNHQPNNQARIIQNVFVKFYAGRLQPYIAMIEQQGRPWIKANQTLQDELPIPDVAQRYFDALWGGKNSVYGTYQQARERHTQAWQRLLGQCGLMPSK